MNITSGGGVSKSDILGLMFGAEYKVASTEDGAGIRYSLAQDTTE